MHKIHSVTGVNGRTAAIAFNRIVNRYEPPAPAPVTSR